MATMDNIELESLNRRELQKLCKEHGIKANRKVRLVMCMIWDILTLDIVELVYSPDVKVVKTCRCKRYF